MEPYPNLDQVIKSCKELFAAQYGAAEAADIVVKAPGRVNIIGEHTDYNDGFVFPMAIPMYSVIVGRKNNSDTINFVTNADVKDSAKKMTFKAPRAGARLTPGDPSWGNYIKGVVEHFPADVPGFDAAIVTSVPLGAGLSSSAALEVATCTFLEQLTGHDLKLSEKALLCQKAEHTFANMPCGIMDQFISCMGKQDCALMIDCRSLDTKLVNLTVGQKGDGEKVVFLVVNSNVKHQLTGSEYPQRRADCMEAAKALGVSSLRDASMAMLRDNRDKLEDRIYQRALHVVTEIERVVKAEEAMANGDYEVLGRLMYQSHVSLRDLYAVSVPEIDQLVDISMKTKGVFGARITGGGFGGCVVVLVQASAVDDVVKAINSEYTKKATCYVFTPVDGAGRV